MNQVFHFTAIILYVAVDHQQDLVLQTSPSPVDVLKQTRVVAVSLLLEGALQLDMHYCRIPNSSQLLMMTTREFSNHFSAVSSKYMESMAQTDLCEMELPSIAIELQEWTQ